MKSLFDKADTYSLRGVCMILIMLHHIYQYTFSKYDVSYPYPIAIMLQNAGYLTTGVFLMISGFGLSKSMMRHNKLTIDYVVRNVMKLIEPFLFISLIDMVFCFVGGNFEMKTAILNIFSLSLSVGGTLWFMKIIFCLYISYFLLYSMIRDSRCRNKSLFGLIALYILYMYVTKSGTYWFNSIICFPVGVLLATNTKLFTFANKALTKKAVGGWGVILITFVGSIVFASHYVPQSVGLPISIVFQIISSVLFSLLSIAIARYINIVNNLFNYVGKNSLCFYLFHLFMTGFIDIPTSLLYSINIILGALVLTIVFNTFKQLYARIVPNKGPNY